MPVDLNSIDVSRLGVPQDFDEAGFQSWYGERAARLGINPNPDDPAHGYDYRSAYLAGMEPNEEGHWPSRLLKSKDHSRRYVNGVDTRGEDIDVSRLGVPERESPGFWGSFKGGLMESKGLYFGAAPAMLGSALGSDSMRDAGMQYYDEVQKEAEPYAPTVKLEDVFNADDILDGISKAGTWAVEQTGRLVPNILEVGAAAVATGGLGALAPGAAKQVLAKTVLKKGVEKAVEGQAAKIAAKHGLDAAATAIVKEKLMPEATKYAVRNFAAKTGAAGAIFGLEAGGNFAEGMEKGFDNPYSAALTGAAATALDFLGGNIKLIDKLMPGAGKVLGTAIQTGEGQVIKKTAKDIAKAISAKIAKNMGAEAAQESGQELLSIVNVVANTDENLLTWGNAKRISESGAVGALGGGMGGVVDVVTGRGEREGSNVPPPVTQPPPVAPPPVAPTRPGAAPLTPYERLIRRNDERIAQTWKDYLSGDVKAERKLQERDDLIAQTMRDELIGVQEERRGLPPDAVRDEAVAEFKAAAPVLNQRVIDQAAQNEVGGQILDPLQVQAIEQDAKVQAELAAVEQAKQDRLAKIAQIKAAHSQKSVAPEMVASAKVDAAPKDNLLATVTQAAEAQKAARVAQLQALGVAVPGKPLMPTAPVPPAPSSGIGLPPSDQAGAAAPITPEAQVTVTVDEFRDTLTAAEKRFDDLTK